MAGQLRELEQRSLTYERLQAEGIDVRRSWFRTAIPGSDKQATRKVYMGEVANESQRPIRKVACRIQPHLGDRMKSAVRVGLGYGSAPAAAVAAAVASSQGQQTFWDLFDGARMPLVRAGEVAGFVFEVDTEGNPTARVTARFTDDAGLHWQIDPDLHLEKLTSRDDW
jgi:hypothetical protein